MAPPAHDDTPVPCSAPDLVAALWRGGPAARWTPAPPAAPAAPAVCAALDRCAADAEWIAARAPTAAQAAARLLAETARAACAALAGDPGLPSSRTDDTSTLPSLARRRIARMERWLADRAATDPTAEPAANLCLWVLDCLELDAP